MLVVRYFNSMLHTDNVNIFTVILYHVLVTWVVRPRWKLTFSFSLPERPSNILLIIHCPLSAVSMKYVSCEDGNIYFCIS